MIAIILLLAVFLLPLSAQRGCGWYLMNPPLNNQSERRVISSRPLNEWTHDEAFDTAAECERFLRTMRKDSEEHLKREVNADNIFVRSLYLSSRCIASDDPRLK